jgi:NDP-sugar pyrophosphorylase family protein
LTAPTLIIMAAGIGSRYGGLKQVDPIGPNGEIIIDYSVYDALRAGFDKIVFVIRQELEEAFREKIGRQVEQRVQTAYVFQDVSDVPPGIHIPPERSKPWGTAHAVLSCKDVVSAPFAVINADDFYGRQAFEALSGYLSQAQDGPQGYDYCMAGYVLRNTLSEFGSVARGVCTIDSSGYLVAVNERTKIERDGSDARYSEDGQHWTRLPGDAIVSMNCWGFTPSFFAELEAEFPRFFQRSADNLLKAEFFLPDVVNSLLQAGKARVRVLPVAERWFGVTNKADRPVVQAALRELVENGVYPRDLWAAL